MTTEPDIAAAARVLADPTRASMCRMLMDGRFHTAGELARAGAVTPPTASEHLARLVESGFVVAVRQGRHRYFRLSGAEHAGVVESLGLIAPPVPARTLRQHRAGEALSAGRTCYDHLADRLGVVLTDALVAASVLDDRVELIDLSPLRDLALDEEGLHRREAPARACVDWTERRRHVAGPFAAVLAARLLELGWVVRYGSSRAVRLSETGRGELDSLLGTDLAAALDTPAEFVASAHAG